MAKPLVTIVVNNYNYERYLRAAIDSALAQTHSPLEVVVVDDGSSDRSPEIIATYGERIVPVLKANGGQGSAVNAGFAVSRGDIVFFLDADDTLDPDAVERVLPLFDAERRTALAMFRLRMVDGHGRPTGHVRPRRPGVMPDGDLRDHVLRYRCFHWQPTSGLAFSRAALDAVLPVPEQEYRISADAYLAGLVPLVGPVRSTDAVCGAYRVHGKSSYTDGEIDAEHFRQQIARIRRTHAHAVRLGRDIGVDVPADVFRARDAAFLGFRLASLVLDPGGHPVPGDRRWMLAARGVIAAMTNRQLALPNRLRRSTWFAATGLFPRGPAARMARERAPDTPIRRARMVRDEVRARSTERPG